MHSVEQEGLQPGCRCNARQLQPAIGAAQVVENQGEQRAPVLRPEPEGCIQRGVRIPFQGPFFQIALPENTAMTGAVIGGGLWCARRLSCWLPQHLFASERNRGEFKPRI